MSKTVKPTGFDLMTDEDVMDALAITEHQLDRLRRSRKLRYALIGQSRRYRRADVEAFLDAVSVGGEQR